MFDLDVLRSSTHFSLPNVALMPEGLDVFIGSVVSTLVVVSTRLMSYSLIVQSSFMIALTADMFRFRLGLTGLASNIDLLLLYEPGPGLLIASLLTNSNLFDFHPL